MSDRRRSWNSQLCLFADQKHAAVVSTLLCYWLYYNSTRLRVMSFMSVYCFSPVLYRNHALGFALIELSLVLISFSDRSPVQSSFLNWSEDTRFHSAHQNWLISSDKTSPASERLTFDQNWCVFTGMDCYWTEMYWLLMAVVLFTGIDW